jgi:hypothetical protein
MLFLGPGAEMAAASDKCRFFMRLSQAAYEITPESTLEVLESLLKKKKAPYNSRRV